MIHFNYAVDPKFKHSHDSVISSHNCPNKTIRQKKSVLFFKIFFKSAMVTRTKRINLLFSTRHALNATLFITKILSKQNDKIIVETDLIKMFRSSPLGIISNKGNIYRLWPVIILILCRTTPSTDFASEGTRH